MHRGQFTDNDLLEAEFDNDKVLGVVHKRYRQDDGIQKSNISHNKPEGEILCGIKL
jgi:hypothetical protein